MPCDITGQIKLVCCAGEYAVTTQNWTETQRFCKERAMFEFDFHCAGSTRRQESAHKPGLLQRVGNATRSRCRPTEENRPTYLCFMAPKYLLIGFALSGPHNCQDYVLRSYGEDLL